MKSEKAYDCTELEPYLVFGTLFLSKPKWAQVLVQAPICL